MDITKSSKKSFTRQLVAWHSNDNNRDLPWKNERDAYRIWLSEVILQQTRALQGLPYYINFTTTYPTVADLARADDNDVFRLWQGLGYYNRCKNLLATARHIAGALEGKFPDTYEGLLELKGIGPYTAAAIASFAYGLPQAVVDGNVYRVLSRCFGIDTPFDTTEGKRIFAELAQDLLDKKDSGAYNQAIMDLGATVCTPSNPKCEQCPLQKDCIARNNNLISLLPVRSKKTNVRKRYFNYLLLICDNEMWIEKRGTGDIWENLHQPYLIETAATATIEELKHNELYTSLRGNVQVTEHQSLTSQRLTHQQIYSNFYTITLSKKPIIKKENGTWVSIDELKRLAFPKTLVSFFKNNLYF